VTAALALRFAARELRTGLAGFRILVVSLALGVAAIAGIGTIGAAMLAAIGSEGRAILGGDLSAGLAQRPLDGAPAAALVALGPTSTVVQVTAMLRPAAGDDQALVAVKAVDGAYPLVGTVRLAGGGDLAAALAPDGSGRPGLVAEATALDRLGLAVGAEVELGRGRFRIADTLMSEPDRAGGGISLGPRVMIRAADLAATGLADAGSLATWRTRVLVDGVGGGAADAAALEATVERLKAAFPDVGWDLRSRFDAAPGLKASIQRFVDFLALIGFAALVVGGVGVGNSVRVHLDARQASIAALKCLGASGGFVFSVYFFQVLAIAAVGVLLGLAAGVALPYLAAGMAARFIAVPIDPAPSAAALALAAGFGMLIAAAFALIPLGRAHDVPATAILRAETRPLAGLPRRRYLVAIAATVVLLVALTLAGASDPLLSARFLGGLAVSFLVLIGLGRAIRWTARRLPAAGPTEWRLAVAALHRPGAATGSVVLSLGLGLTLVVALAEVDGNLRRQLNRQLPEVAPTFFFLEVPNAGLDHFLAVVADAAPGGRVEHVPMMRGRIVTLKGELADEAKAAASARWALNGDRGITYAATAPANARVVAGTWWAPDYDGPPLVSVEREVAAGLGLGVGDTIGVNVMGREITATVANLRQVRWESLGINFVMVFSPNTFRGAPHGHLTTLALKGGGDAAGEARVLKAVTADFPTVTAIRVKDALEAAADMIRALTDGARLAALVAIAAAVLVLASALATGQTRRVREATLLKVLGATRRRVVATYAVEYGLVGGVVAVAGLFGGTAIAAYVVGTVMRLDFSPDPVPAVTLAFSALAVTVAVGLTGTLAALSRSSASTLRRL
jgi:putative ABC transport system permease protein